VRQLAAAFAQHRNISGPSKARASLASSRAPKKLARLRYCIC